MRRILPAVIGLLLVLLLSCASGPIQDDPLMTSFALIPRECKIPGSFSATPELQVQYDQLIAGGDRNAMLNFSRLGLRAFRMGDFCTAEAALDEAERRTARLIAEDRETAKARSKFGREEAKWFKGDPYERSMLYLYRGLLFYAEGEYDNARACFRSGLLADAFAEGEEYRADYVSLDYLEARADSHYAGNNVADLMEAAHGILPGERYVPPLDPSQNVLVVVESGAAPIKYGAGPHREQLTFAPGMPRGGVRCVLSVNGEEVARAENPTEDVYYQASTRGGRELDYILAGQARFKDTADAAGDVMVFSGAIIAAEGFDRDNDTLKGIGGALALGGLFAKGLAAGTKPEADIRAWDNLPDRLHIFSISVGPGLHTITAELFTEGAVVADVTMRNFRIHEGDPERVVLLTAKPKETY